MRRLFPSQSLLALTSSATADTEAWVPVTKYSNGGLVASIAIFGSKEAGCIDEDLGCCCSYC